MNDIIKTTDITDIEGVSYDDLVDTDVGVQHSKIYTSKEVFDKEQENIFSKCWLMVGHESQLPKSGDYFVSKMGTDSVIVTRKPDGDINVMLNQCRHRGVKLVRGDYGNARSFTCSYHGWCYDTKGDLVGIPHSDRQNPCFKKDDWGLVTPPRIELFMGFIFACWDENVEPLDDYLGEVKWYMQACFDRAEGGTELIGLQKWIVRGNWKFGAEQHASDFYHAQVSHVSYIDAFFPGGSINRLKKVGDPEYGLQYSSPTKGHGAGWLSYPDEAALQELIETRPKKIVDYVRDVQFERVTERLGKVRGKEMAVLHMNIFPNFTVNKGQGYVRLWQPISPNETECWSFVFVDKDMPQDIKDAHLTAKANIFSVTGGLEQDDTENTACAQLGLTGHIASKTQLNITMGEPKTPPADFDGPGIISDVYSEVALRGFYRRWNELMSEDSK